MRRGYTFMLLFLLAGCQLVDPGSSVWLPGRDQDFTNDSYPLVVKLRVGGTATLPRGEAVITFEKVTADSRCPIGLRCFWAGDGEVKLVVQSSTAADTTCTLHTTVEPKSVSINALAIALQKLDPYPEYPKEIDPFAYIATLEIDKMTR